MPYLATSLMTIAPLFIGAILRALAARHEAKALAEENRAKRLRGDRDPSNDALADRLEESAANRRADAAALRAANKRNDT
jgi:hypothetical protein